MVMCRNVKVPWERVFVADDAVLARNIYIETPGHSFGNHQANVRFLSKLQLLVGVASRVAQSSGADQIPAVRETLGRLSALEGCLSGMIAGQIQDHESWPGGDEGYVCFNRRYVYAALNWCTENHSNLIDIVRELCGGGVFQMPASIDVMCDETLREQFEQYWSTPQLKAPDESNSSSSHGTWWGLSLQDVTNSMRSFMRVHRSSFETITSAKRLGTTTTVWLTG